MLSVQTATPFPQIDLLSQKFNNGKIPRTLDIMELNTTKYYDRESNHNNSDLQVLASNYLAYKVGKSIKWRRFINLVIFWKFVLINVTISHKIILNYFVLIG